jgi:hypothetical protein
MSGPTIHFPTEEENSAALKEFFERLKYTTEAHFKAAIEGAPALARLCDVMSHKTDQSYHVRALLYSLWNGKPASLVKIVNLDWQIRTDICAVIMGFGFECKNGFGFFYTAIQTAVESAGLWDWFLEERKNIRSMREYVKAVEHEEAT